MEYKIALNKLFGDRFQALRAEMRRRGCFCKGDFWFCPNEQVWREILKRANLGAPVAPAPAPAPAVAPGVAPAALSVPVEVLPAIPAAPPSVEALPAPLAPPAAPAAAPAPAMPSGPPKAAPDILTSIVLETAQKANAVAQVAYAAAPPRLQARNASASVSVAAPAAPSAPLPSSALRASRTSEENLERARKQLEIATQGGFSIPETYYALGTAINSVGVENFRIKRAEWEQQDKVADGMEKLIDRIQKERRSDVSVAVGKIGVDSSTGFLQIPGIFSDVVPSVRGWSQLLSFMRTPPHAAAYTSGIQDPAWRAEEFRRFQKDSNGREVVLRLRHPGGRHGRPELFSTVSDRYTPFGVAEGARAILGMVQSGKLSSELRTEVKYRGGSARISLSGFSDVKPENGVCGEIFQAGVGLRLSDDKSSGNSGWAEFLRNLCLNLIMIGEGRAAAFSVRHIGSAEDLEAIMVEGIRNAQDKVEPFMQMWSLGRAVPLDALELLSVARALVGAEEGARKADAIIAVPGMPGPHLLNWILEAYKLEPEPNKIGLINAISRTPQVGQFADAVEAEEILASAAHRILEMVELPHSTSA